MKVITLRGTGFLSKTERYGGVLLAKICLEALATAGFLGASELLPFYASSHCPFITSGRDTFVERFPLLLPPCQLMSCNPLCV